MPGQGGVRGALWPPRIVPLGIVLLAVACGSAVLAYRAEASPDLRPWPVLWLWIGSMVAFLAGAAVLQARHGAFPVRPRPSKAELVGLLGLSVAALLVRTIQLGRIPANFSGDEGELGVFSRYVVAGEWNDPFTTGVWSHPTLWFYIQALSLKVFGDGVVGLRMLTALIGTATVLALFLFARRWYGTRVALMAAALLVAYHFHVHFSRIGLNQATDGLFALVGFGLAIAGWQARSPLLLASAGISVGFAQNLYYGTRLEMYVLLVLLVHQVVVARTKVMEVARYLPLVVVGFLIGWGPGIRVPIHQWDDYNARFAVVGVFESGWFHARQQLGDSSLGIMAHQLGNSLGAITTVADRGPHYSPGMPLLDPVSSSFFLLGLALVIYRWRRLESGLLLTWLVLALLGGGVLLVNPPESQRFVTLAPLICLLMALGLDLLGRGLERVVPAMRPDMPALLAIVVAAVMAWNLNFYFRDYTPRRTYGFRATESATAISEYIAARPGSFVYFFGPPYAYLGNGTIAFVARAPDGLDVPGPIGAKGLPVPPVDHGPLMIFYPPRAGEAAAVRRRYPGTPLRLVHSEVDGVLLFVTYTPAAAGWPAQAQ